MIFYTNKICGSIIYRQRSLLLILIEDFNECSRMRYSVYVTTKDYLTAIEGLSSYLIILLEDLKIKTRIKKLTSYLPEKVNLLVVHTDY